MKLPSLFQLQPALYQPPPATSESSSSPHIPRPANSFILYRMWKTLHLPKVPKGAPPRKLTDISAIMGPMWRAETESVVQYFEELAEEGRQLHKLKYPDYKYQPKRKQNTRGKGKGSSSAPADGGPSRLRSSRRIRSQVRSPLPQAEVASQTTAPISPKLSSYDQAGPNPPLLTPSSPLAVSRSSDSPASLLVETTPSIVLDNPSASYTDTSITQHEGSLSNAQLTRNDADQWPFVFDYPPSSIPTWAAPSTSADTAGLFYSSAMNIHQNSWNQQAYEFGVPITPADDPLYLYDISCGHFPDEHNANCAAGRVYPCLSLGDQPGGVDVSIGTLPQAGIMPVFDDEFSNTIPQYGDEEPFDIFDPVRFEAEDYSRFSSDDFYKSHFDAPNLTGEALETPMFASPHHSQSYHIPTEGWTGYTQEFNRGTDTSDPYRITI